MSFNIAQLATWEQARALAAELSAGPFVVGSGVRPESTDVEKSGIYILDLKSWFAETPHWEDPTTGEKYLFLHFRFNNGGSGMNVGLVREQFKRYPMSPGYVLWQLAEEAGRLATA